VVAASSRIGWLPTGAWWAGWEGIERSSQTRSDYRLWRLGATLTAQRHLAAIEDTAVGFYWQC